MKFKKSYDGIAHIAIILLIVVLAVAGAAGYLVWKKQSDDKSSSSSSTDTSLSKAEIKQLDEECNKKYNDEDLCKFLSSWTDVKQYQITSTSTSEGESYQYTMEIDGDDNYIKSQSSLGMYEVISIGKTTYTKDQSDGAWWKQTSGETTTETEVKDDFTFDSKDDITEEADTTTYKSLGKEACGNLECFKYEIVDTTAPGDKQYVWFDTKDHQMRRWQTVSADGSTSDSTFSYEKKDINEPSPTKDVPAGSYVGLDGSLVTIPTTTTDIPDYSEDTPVEE